ncbi:MAG: peptidase C1, partial [Gemmatimonadetes bacterium]|nr:peptidase C1 [Gemmatimonadota bacterium]
APAGTVDLFTDLVQPFLKAPHPDFRIQEMTIYNLDDELEQDDEVTKAYNKSLLYLVSRAFEEETPEKILGMEKYSKTVERRILPRLTIHYAPSPRVTMSETHGGFDNDLKTMNHVLKRVCGGDPRKPFTEESLDY